MPNADYDVFIAYHSEDENAVTPIANWLRGHSLRLFFAKDLPPGTLWVTELRHAIERVCCFIAFIGPGLGRWQSREFLRAIKLADESRPPGFLIPVLLPGIDEIPDEIQVLLGELVPVRWALGSTEDAKLLQAIQDAVCRSRASTVFDIEIEVQRAARSCFVAMPASGRLESYEAVEKAVRSMHQGSGGQQRVSLPDKVTRWSGNGDARTERADFVQEIRESELVLADCRPENGTGQISPYVAYQLGMAHALGKPTVLITTDTMPVETQIPSAAGQFLPAMETVKIAAGAAQDLTAPVTKAIQAICRQVEAPFLIDKKVKGMQVLSADLKHLRSKHWPQFHRILSFGLKTHSESNTLREQSNSFLAFTSQLAGWVLSERGQQRNENATAARSKDLTEKYNAFRLHHQKWEETYYADFQLQRAVIDSTFEDLKPHLGKDLCQPLIGSQEAWRLVVDDLAAYRKRYENLAEFAADGFNCLGFRGSTEDLESQTQLMNSALGLIYANALNMMTNLLEVVLEDNERGGPSGLSRTANA
jgi:TIR domain